MGTTDVEIVRGDFLLKDAYFVALLKAGFLQEPKPKRFDFPNKS